MAPILNADSNQSKYAWAKESVNFLISHGAIENYENEAQTLGRTVTKADLTLMIHRLFTEFRVESDQEITIPGVPQTHPAFQTFKDVYGSIPSNPNGLIAAADKINYKDETFTYNPEKVLTRWDALITLNVLFEDIGNSVADLTGNEAASKLKVFKDIPKRYFTSNKDYEKWKYAYQPLAPEIGLYTNKKNSNLASDLDYVKSNALLGFSKAGIMKADTRGYFHPNQKITLAETAVILHRIYTYYDGTGYIRKPTQEDLITNGTRHHIYKDFLSGFGGSTYDFALVNSEDLSECYLTIVSSEKVDLQIIVNGHPTLYTYEQLNNPKEPVRISFDGAYYVEVIPIKQSTGEKIEPNNNNIITTYYLSDTKRDFTEFFGYEY